MTKTPRVLQKIRLDEVSVVDAAANPGAQVKLVKRNERPTPFATREAALQSIADRETQQAMAKSQPVGRPMTEYEQYRARLFAPVVTKREPTPTAPPANPAYQRLEAMAKRAAESDPSLSEAQHFARLIEQPEHRSLFAKAKSLADDDSDDDDDTDPDGDDDGGAAAWAG